MYSYTLNINYIKSNIKILISLVARDIFHSNKLVVLSYLYSGENII